MINDESAKKGIDKHWQMPPNKKKAIYLAKRMIAAFVYDAVNLEGINFTFPEIQTMLDGVTIGGRKLSDQQIVLNQNNAYKELMSMVHDDEFSLDKETACKLHNILGFQDALEWGKFRVNEVGIAGTSYRPPAHQNLNQNFSNMVKNACEIEDIYDRACFVFLEMARNQFFYDNNKRTGRLMMNGILLQNGYPAINVEAKNKLKFNQLMLKFYETGEKEEMNKFLRSCLPKEQIEFMRSTPPKTQLKSMSKF